MKVKSIGLWVLLASLLFSSPVLALPVTITVGPGGMYETIQEGIDAANPGDTVLVYAGTYPGNINFNGKTITVRSFSPEAMAVIQGTGAGSVVTFSGTEDANCLLSDFTITGGNTTGDGGGICGNGTEAMIANCVITDNHADGAGGGASDCNGTILGCSISNNSAADGGGLNNCGGEIVHCTIADNNSIGDGGGLNNCSTITNCIISNNSTEGDGGGMLCAGNTTVINCTLSGNSAGFKGGGIFCTDTGVLTMANSILWGNSAMFGPQIYIFGGSVGITHSDVEGGHAGEGNIDADPQFVGPGGGDFHLGPNSPCIDAGDNNSVPPSLVADLDGDERIINGAVDMGADEVAMYELTVLVVGAGMVDPNSGSYFAGTVVTLTAMPDEGYVVGQWSGTDNDASCATTNAVTMGSDRIVTVGFGLPQDFFVPGQYPTIQGAIDAAACGDRVIVAAGVHHEDINFNGKSITVSSQNPDDPNIVAVTIINGTGAGPVVTFSGSEYESVLDGLTVTGGNTPGDGGGICGNGTEATIANCVITGNHADGDGGGVSDCNGAILRCTIAGNTAGAGGGLSDCDGTILGCSISNNSASDGGGLNNCDGEIVDCAIADNNAFGNGGGLNNCSSTIANSIITDNSSSSDGGGMLCAGNSTVINCTISRNSSGFKGGGIFCADTGVLTMANSILWGNSAMYGPQMYVFGGSVAITYSDVEGGHAGEGNINSNPMFVDANTGDWHLGAGSPCIDAGDNNSVPPSLVEDLDGNARIINGVVDMGPYENTYYYVDGINGDDNNDGRSPETAFATIQKGIDTAEDGCVVLVFPAEYLEPDPWDPESISFLGKNIKVTSAEPGDWDIVESTVVRGIVLFDGSEDANCVFTGFTVRDLANGAIYGNHTRATISHCIISGNGPCGATVIENCAGIISNCLIADNLTIYLCGVYPVVMGCHGVIENCTIANNASGIGILDGGETSIENCIIYGNGDPNIFEPQILVGSAGLLNISYSNLEGGPAGISNDGTVNWDLGNIEADPCFVRLGWWDYEPWPWELAEGDYHLKSEGWRLSEYGPWWVYDDVTSRSIDWGNPGSPLGAELMSVPRDPNNTYGVNVRINMGAYGGTAEASMAPHGWVLLSDLDNDGATTLADLGRQVEDWLRCESGLPGDLNRDGQVDITDYAILASEWEPGEDTTPPVPNPMQWDYTVMDVNGYAIDGTPHEIYLGSDYPWGHYVTMRADPTTVDPEGNGLEFYFKCTNNDGFDSQWLAFDAPPYIYTRYVGLWGQTLYFQVKARDLSPNHNETAWSEVLLMYVEW